MKMLKEIALGIKPVVQTSGSEESFRLFSEEWWEAGEEDRRSVESVWRSAHPVIAWSSMISSPHIVLIGQAMLFLG